MGPRLVLLAAVCGGLNPVLKAEPEGQPVNNEPRIVSGTFADAEADPAGQPVALWLEQGHGLLSSAASLPSETAPALLLPAQGPVARACLLLNAPEAPVSSLRLRLKLEATSPENEPATPEVLEWELAGVPLRFARDTSDTSDTSGGWRVDYHTAESGWRPLLAPEGEDLGSGSGWHTLALEFSSTEEGSRQWRLRWDEREPGPWIARARAEAPLLVASGGTSTAVWLDDLASTEESAAPAEAPPADPAEAAAALAARNAALRAEIAATLAALTRETGVRRQLLRRPVGVIRAHSAQTAQTGGLTVLTPLEERQTEPAVSPAE